MNSRVAVLHTVILHIFIETHTQKDTRELFSDTTEISGLAVEKQFPLG